MDAAAAAAATTESNKFDKTVLLIGTALPKIESQLEQQFQTVHRLLPRQDDDDDDDTRNLTWLQQHGSNIDYVLTSNYYGVEPDYWKYLLSKPIQLVSSNGVGYDNIDVTLAQRQQPQILVTHTPGVLDAETSTTALLLYLAVYRRLISCERHARTGRWNEQGPHPLTRTADGRRVGLLGLGRIGTAIARKLRAFDCAISYHARTRRTDVDYRYFDNLRDLARHVECLVVICPGGPATRHLVNAEILQALGRDGMLINVARGSVVDEPALIAALQKGDLAGAGLDVFEHEPHIPAELRALANDPDHQNVVLLPHVGSATVETRLAMGQLALDNLVQHARDGTVLTPVPECQAYARVAVKSRPEEDSR